MVYLNTYFFNFFINNHIFRHEKKKLKKNMPHSYISDKKLVYFSMEQLVNILVSSVLSVYLPISDTGSRIAISMAVAGIISKLLYATYDFLVSLDIINYFFNVGKSYVIIDPDNPMYDKLLKHIYDKYNNMLSGCKLENDVGKNKLMAVKIKKSIIKEKYDFDNQTYDIEFSLEQTDKNQSDKKNNDKIEPNNKPNVIVRSNSSIKIIESYLNIFIQSVNNKISNKIPIYRTDITNKKDNKTIKWKCTVTKLSKNIKNTIVSDLVEKNFYADINNFINGEQFYLNRGLPYKRGYILYGEPGCGKTSLIKAIANQYRLPIFIIDLNMIKDNGELIKITNDISSHLIDDQKYLVVYEDIDRSSLFRNRWNNSRVTIDCFLNVLDGVDEFYGRITILTANDYEKLSETKALIRPGRVDTIVEVTTCTIKQIESIIKFYFGRIDSDIIKLDASIIITPAQLTQLILMVNDIDKVINVLNKNKNFSKINLEKVNAIYHEAISNDIDIQNSVSDLKEINNNANVNDDDESDDPDLYRKNIIKKVTTKLSLCDLKINQQKDIVDTLSGKARLAYDRLVLNKKSFELQIIQLNKTLELAQLKRSFKDDQSKQKGKRCRS